MNLYEHWFFAPQNRFCRVSQQTFLNNTQPGRPSRRHFSLRALLAVPTAFLALAIAPGKAEAASLTSTPSSVSYGTVPVGNKVTQTLAIKNVTRSSVTVASYYISNSVFSITSLTVPLSIDACDSTTYTFFFLQSD